MAKGNNQKSKLLMLAKIFNEETDENHGLTMPEIIARLQNAGIDADRKTLYQDFEELKHFGYDIVSERAGRATVYSLASRDFELAELKLLVDSVQSSRFITERKSRSLIKKLEGLVSIHDAKALQRQVLIAGRIKTMNESIYYNVDKLHAAIAENCQIQFRYFHWNVHKQEEYRRGEGCHTVSPWHLRWDDENYYLIAFDAESGKLRHYRVDKMKSIKLLDAPRQGQQELASFDPTVYTRRLFGMYGGEPAKITVEGENRMVGILIDRFGKEIPIIPLEGGRFRAHIEAAVSPQFLGWIASLSDGLKVVAPEDVVTQLKALAERLQGQYGQFAAAKEY